MTLDWFDWKQVTILTVYKMLQAHQRAIPSFLRSDITYCLRQLSTDAISPQWVFSCLLLDSKEVSVFYKTSRLLQLLDGCNNLLFHISASLLSGIKMIHIPIVHCYINFVMSHEHKQLLCLLQWRVCWECDSATVWSSVESVKAQLFDHLLSVKECPCILSFLTNQLLLVLCFVGVHRRRENVSQKHSQEYTISVGV